MSVLKYIKQRWYLLAIVFAGGLFAFAVYWANGSDALLYVLEGLGVSLVVFIIIDFFVLRDRVKKMARFLREEDASLFSYPLDAIYADKINSVIAEHKRYRETIETQHANEIEFITKWVHDVKVPISAIKLLTDSIDDEMSQQLQMQTLHVEQNIQKILYHIKSKSLHEDYTIKPVKIKSMISLALKQYAVFFSYKKIALVFECSDVTVATDEKWSGYIISQIISNAVKYTPESGKIVIRAFQQGESVVVSIKNTGDGIDAQSLKDVFNRGFSGSSLRHGSATGYGLYLSKKLADIMGHELYAKSAQGQYAEFCFAFNVTKP